MLCVGTQAETHDGNQIFWNDFIESGGKTLDLILNRGVKSILGRVLHKFSLILLRNRDALASFFERDNLINTKLRRDSAYNY